MNTKEAVKAAVNGFMQPVIDELEKYAVDSEKVAESIVHHAITLHANHRDWKPEKVVRKVVERFKLKQKES